MDRTERDFFYAVWTAQENAALIRLRAWYVETRGDTGAVRSFAETRLAFARYLFDTGRLSEGLGAACGVGGGR